MRPELLTFDFFGTVVDWRGGLLAAAARHGRAISPEEFERIVDVQGALEQAPGPFRLYADIVAESLTQVLNLSPAVAQEIGAGVGTWPLYPDSREALRRLGQLAPCAAMTNSDIAHGIDVRAQLGFPLAHWLCAEDLRTYKPNPEFWKKTAERIGITPSKSWFHVSAYADYDLQEAQLFGLTTIFVARPHHRRGEADLQVSTLQELADHLEASI